MKPRLPVLIAALALAAGTAAGEQLPLKIYTTADGLPSDRIHCILPDSRGFLWIGTSDGASRFDGYTFRNFGEVDGLPATAVQAIVETRDGACWLGTGRGLFRLDPSRTPAPGASLLAALHVPGGAEADSVGALLEDRQGTLWIGTQAGLFRLAKGGAAIEPVALPAPGGNAVAALASSRDRLPPPGAAV